MTVRIVVECNGTWDDGSPCRTAFLSRSMLRDGAREEANHQGWSSGPGRDRCPAHAALAREGQASA